VIFWVVLVITFAGNKVSTLGRIISTGSKAYGGSRFFKSGKLISEFGPFYPALENNENSKTSVFQLWLL
jgi:hypothetical protein